MLASQMLSAVKILRRCIASKPLILLFILSFQSVFILSIHELHFSLFSRKARGMEEVSLQEGGPACRV